MAANSVNHAEDGLMLRVNKSIDVKFTGAGTFNGLLINGTNNFICDITFTGGAVVKGSYLDACAGSTLTVNGGADVEFSSAYSRINGDITVENAKLSLWTLSNDNADSLITVKDGGILLNTSNWTRTYGSMDIQKGGQALLNGSLQVGNGTDEYLSVSGVLSIDSPSTLPFTIRTTLPGDQALLLNNAMVAAPENFAADYIFKNADDSSTNSKEIGIVKKESGSWYYGSLTIVPDDTEFTELTAIDDIIGKAEYTETLIAGEVSPAGATVSYFWQSSYSKNGPWTDYDGGRTFELDTRYVDRYIRVGAKGSGVYSGTVYSDPIGPVIGDPHTLKALYVGDNGGWGPKSFNGNSFNGWSMSTYGDGNPVETVYHAIPVSEDAVISMTLQNALYTEPVELNCVNGAADVLLQPGNNTITITVNYGGMKNEYTVSHLLHHDDSSFYLENYVGEGVTLTATVHLEDGDEVLTAGYNESKYLGNVPYGTEISLSAETPDGTRIWNYDGIKADVSKANSPASFRHSGDTYRLDLYKYSLCAAAPESIDVSWDFYQEGKANIDVPAIMNNATADPYDYYAMELKVYDESGECVATVSTEDGYGTNTENIISFPVMDLDPAKQYTFEAYNKDLFVDNNVPRDIQCAYAVLEPMTDEFYLIPSSEHIVLKPGETAELTFEFNGLEGAVISCTESSDTAVIDNWNWDQVQPDSDDPLKFTVTAGETTGTAWLTFEGETRTINVPGGISRAPIHAYVRVDVSSNDDPTAEKLSLGETSGSLNIYNDSTLILPVYNMDCGHEILGAEFTDSAVNSAFDIKVLNDRTLEVIPKVDKAEGDTWAAWTKSKTGSYTSAIRVKYRDAGGSISRISAETLTIKITAKAPSVKAGAVKLNSFYQGTEAALVFTTKDGTVEKLLVDESKATAKAPACPEWLTLNEDMTVTLDNSMLTNNKGSGKLNLEVWLEGWRAPAQIAVSVSAAYTAPKLKLSPNTLSLPENSGDFDSHSLMLMPSDKKLTLEDVGVTGVRFATRSDIAKMSPKDRTTYAVSPMLEVWKYNTETGEITFGMVGSITNGKALLIVTIGGDPDQTVSLPVTVKAVAAPTLKASSTKVALNTALGIGSYTQDVKEVTLIPSAAGYRIDEANTAITVINSKKAECKAQLDIEQYNNVLTFSCNEETVEGETYKVTVQVDGIAKPVAITVTTKATLPKLKADKTSITMNRAMGYNYSQDVIITAPGYDNFSLYDNTEITVTDAKGNDAEGELQVYKNGKNRLCIYIYTTTRAISYKVNVVHTLPNGKETSISIAVKVVDKLPTVKLNPSSITLFNSTVNNEAVISVKGLEDYDWNSYQLTDSKGESYANPGVDYSFDSATSSLRISLDSPLEAGQTYKLYVTFHMDYGLKTKPAAITLKVVDKPTASISAKGNMDITRPDSTKTDFTFKYTGWTPAAYDGFDSPRLRWEVYAMNGKEYVTDGVLGSDGLVSWGECYGDAESNSSSGWFTNASSDPYGLSLMLSKTSSGGWAQGYVNPKYTYSCKLYLDLRNDAGDVTKTIEFKPVKLTIKQGTTKFAPSVKEVSLSRLDGYGRQLFSISSTDKDAADVAKIARIELVSSALADELTITQPNYDPSLVILGWKGNTPAAVKSGTVKLNVFLEGNETDKPNGTVSIKVNIK